MEKLIQDIFVTYQGCPKNWTKEFMFENLLFKKLSFEENKTKVAKYIILEKIQTYSNDYDCLLVLNSFNKVYLSELEWSIEDKEGNKVKGLAEKSNWIKKYFEMEKKKNKIGWGFIGIWTKPELRWEENYSIKA